MTQNTIIAALQQHAIEHYEQGWDVVTETYTSEKIARVLVGQNITTLTAATAYFQEWVVDTWLEQLANSRF